MKRENNNCKIISISQLSLNFGVKHFSGKVARNSKAKIILKQYRLGCTNQNVSDASHA